LHNPCESTNAKDSESIPSLSEEKNEIDITDLNFDKAYSEVWNKMVLNEGKKKLRFTVLGTLQKCL
jgi:hypothetical protein